MKQRRRIYYSAAQRSEIWDRWQRGESMSSIGRGFERGLPTIPASHWPLMSMFIFVIPKARGSAARMRTPIACSDNISREEPVYPYIVRQSSTPWHGS